jgi:SAM-dependent methyltransferase
VPADRPHSALDVLYSTSPLLLSTPNTLLAGDRVCTGAQSDDFAVAGLLTGARRVLLLGLGYGAAIRTIAAFLPDARITAVDSDAATGTICTDLYRLYFPRLGFDFVHRDALEYLRGTTERYDVICVDLYLPEGYPDVLTDPELWAAVRDRLTPTGVALANAGGLPAHLRPLDPPSPQLALLSVLTRHWPNPAYLVNKRNWTFILGVDPADIPDPVLADRALRAGRFTGADRAVLSLLPLRLRAAARVGDIARVTPEPFPRQRIEDEVQARWPELVTALRTAAQPHGIDPARARPEHIVTDYRAGPVVLRELLDTGSGAADFFASAAASLAMAREPAAGWFGRWVCDEADRLAETHPNWLVSTALPQAVAMVAAPLAPRWRWAHRLLDVVDRIVERGWPLGPGEPGR